MPRRGGRPEQPVAPGAPYADVAMALRRLKGRSGLSYREMARATGYPMSVLAEAARGRRMPRLDLLRAFVRACGGQPGDHEHQWHELIAQVKLPGQVRLSAGLAGSAPATTRRELDVLVSLCGPRPSDGVYAVPPTVREIATDLAVTDAAVKQHLRKLYRKFNVPAGSHRRTRLANAVVASGLLSPVAETEGLPPSGAFAARSAGESDWQRADLLARHGDLGGAARVLQSRAGGGDLYAARLLAALLAGQGDLAGLRARAAEGDKDAQLLATLLADREDTGGADGIRQREAPPRTDGRAR
jgi:transcriptional regulator with XRE-family HTH domain